MQTDSTKCLILIDLTNDMWSFHVNFSSMITPKNFVAQTLVIISTGNNTIVHRYTHIVNIFTIAK